MPFIGSDKSSKLSNWCRIVWTYVSIADTSVKWANLIEIPFIESSEKFLESFRAKNVKHIGMRLIEECLFSSLNQKHPITHLYGIVHWCDKKTTTDKAIKM